MEKITFKLSRDWGYIAVPFIGFVAVASSRVKASAKFQNV